MINKNLITWIMALILVGVCLVALALEASGETVTVKEIVGWTPVNVYGDKQIIKSYYDKEIVTKTKDVPWEKEVSDPETGVTSIQIGVYKEPIEWKTIQAPRWEHKIIGTKKVPVYTIRIVEIPPPVITVPTVYPDLADCVEKASKDPEYKNQVMQYVYVRWDSGEKDKDGNPIKPRKSLNEWITSGKPEIVEVSVVSHLQGHRPRIPSKSQIEELCK